MKRTLSAMVLAVLLGAAPQANARGMNGFWLGLNGVLTAIADPIDGIVNPPAAYQDLVVNEVTAPTLGFVRGIVLGTYRVISGVFDVATTPLWVVPEMSPQPRFDLVLPDDVVLVRLPFAGPNP